MLFVFVICHSVVSASCGLLVACWKMACLLALWCVVFSVFYVGFQCGVLGHVWCLIASIPDLCHFPYVHLQFKNTVFWTPKIRNSRSFELNVGCIESREESVIMNYFNNPIKTSEKDQDMPQPKTKYMAL